MLITCKLIRKTSNFVLWITAENFSKEILKMEVSNTRVKPTARFNILYYNCYEKNIFPKILNNTKFGYTKGLEELIRRWDDDFICPNKKVHAGKFMNLFIYKLQKLFLTAKCF